MSSTDTVLSSAEATVQVGPPTGPVGKEKIPVTVTVHSLFREYKADSYDNHYPLTPQTVKGKIYYLQEFPDDGEYHFGIHKYPKTTEGQVVLQLYTVNRMFAIFASDIGQGGVVGKGEWATVNSFDSIDQLYQSPSAGPFHDPSTICPIQNRIIPPHPVAKITITSTNLPHTNQEVTITVPSINKEFKGTFYDPQSTIPNQTTPGRMYYCGKVPSDGDSFFNIQQHKAPPEVPEGRLILEFYTKDTYTAIFKSDHDAGEAEGDGNLRTIDS